MITARDATLRLLECQMETVLVKLEALETRMKTMATNMDAIIAAVARNNDVGDSVILLLKDIAQKLKDAGTDAVKLAELTAALNAQADEAAAAVVENTPAEPPV